MAIFFVKRPSEEKLRSEMELDCVSQQVRFLSHLYSDSDFLNFATVASRSSANQIMSNLLPRLECSIWRGVTEALSATTVLPEF